MVSAGGGNKNTTILTTKFTKKRRTRKTKPTHHKNPQNTLRHHHHNKTLHHLLPFLISTTTAAHSFLTHHDLHLLPSQSLSLESYLSSTSLSLSKLLSLLSLPPPSPPPPPLTQHHCWFHRFLSATGSADYDTRWTDTFRMSKPSFSLLLRLVTPSLSSLSLPPNYALAATLFRLAHDASFKHVAHRFGLDSSTVCRAFYTVCKSINENLGHLFELKSDINRIVVGFGWIKLPNCCGVLGFDKFQLEGDLLGENGYLMVQALVDSEGRFLDVSAGWPCTMKPELILRQSKLFSGVEESREFLNGPCFELGDGSCIIPQYILGDSCFPTLSWLLTPYNESEEAKISLGGSERTFNKVHSRGMGLVGTAFGRVRRMWQLVNNKWKEGCIEAFPFVMVACCLLHNFLIKCSEVLPDENVGSREQGLPVFEGEVDESGRRIRDALALHLCRVSQRA